jgi:predicted ArsR family transcriptional regulator
LLEWLQRHGSPVTVAELAAELGMHGNTIRDHLDALVKRGLATRERAAVSGRGRPAWRYAAADDHAEPDPRVRDYAGLSSALAAHIARTSDDPNADALAAGIEWGRTLALAAPGPPATSAAEARRRVVGILAELGFDPAADPRATTVALRRCPLLDTARRYPEIVCSVHLGIVRGALAVLGGEPDRAALLPFAEPEACRLHLHTEPQSGS